jgi:manganese transport system substrate-binding protein
MRRFRAFLTACAAAGCVLTLTACSAFSDGGSDEKRVGGESKAGEKATVLTTFTVLADVAENVAGDNLRVESLTKPGAEIHGYEPTPKDVAKASDADLILDNGLGLETWFKKFLQDTDAPHVMVSKGVHEIPITRDAEAADDEHARGPNPHAWMSPENVSIYVDNMVDAFSSLDPDNAADYAKNGAAYQAKLDKISKRMSKQLSEVPQKQRALVTCEGAFSYLARDADMTEHYLWPVNAESEATPQRVARVTEAVKEDNIPVVFCESTVSDKAMQQVVSATDAEFGGTLYVDSLSEEVPTYLDLLTHDVDLIVGGLTGGEAAND